MGARTPIVGNYRFFFVFQIEILSIFVTQRPMQKCLTLQQPVLGGKVLGQEQEESLNTKNSGLPKFAPLVARALLGPNTY